MFLRQLANLFGNQQIRLNMELANGFVVAAIYRGSNVLKHDELKSAGLLRKLPKPLTTCIEFGAKHGQDRFRLTLPQARKLCIDLRALPSENLILDIDRIEKLKDVAVPANFEIRWTYQADQQFLEHQLIGADRHLGDGWFQKDDTVWGTNVYLSNEILRTLASINLKGTDIVTAVTQTIPTLQKASIRCTSSLAIKDDVFLNSK